MPKYMYGNFENYLISWKQVSVQLDFDPREYKNATSVTPWLCLFHTCQLEAQRTMNSVGRNLLNLLHLCNDII